MKKTKMKIPKSVKIHIRREKARIRKSGIGTEDQEKAINELYQGLGIVKQHDN